MLAIGFQFRRDNFMEKKNRMEFSIYTLLLMYQKVLVWIIRTGFCVSLYYVPFMHLFTCVSFIFHSLWVFSFV